MGGQEMKTYNVEQGSDEWKILRLGRITASDASKILVKSRTKGQVFGDTAMSYLYAKAAEIITGELPPDLDQVYAIAYGKGLEPQARAAFEFITGGAVETLGICTPSEKRLGQYLGFSPDGKFGEEFLEIKCPLNTANHLKFICEDFIRPEYIAQMQFSMMIAKTPFHYFLSYDPRVPQKPIAYKQVFRDEEMIKELKERSELAIQEIEKILQKLEE